jgi:hypothetical protein
VTVSVGVGLRARREARLRARNEVRELADVVSILAWRQRDSVALAAGEWRHVEARDSASAMRHAGLEERLGRVERNLERFADVVLPRRRRDTAILREQIEVLRSRAGVQHVTGRYAASVNGRVPSTYAVASPEPVTSLSGRLGTALMYAGALVLVWLVLWQVALAVGFR